VNFDAGDDLKLHVARNGDGPPVVLLHGFTGCAGSWDSLRPALDDRYTTLSVELPGHGRSSAPENPARYALPRFADDLARLLDSLEIERAALLGYSMGGRAALHFALRHPERVAALVLESASPGIADPAERAARALADAALADEIERGGITAFVDRWEQLPLWASQASLPAEVRSRLRAQRLSRDPRGLANSLRGAGAASQPSVMEDLASYRGPALLVAGALDAKYVELGQLMQATIADSRLAVVPEAGHAVHLERPAALGELVSGFLGALPSARGRWPGVRQTAGHVATRSD
jgi:2-succinyl-6-hydroxy-2,4-cyclohexadiene-1-carboxylate synthase